MGFIREYLERAASDYAKFIVGATLIGGLLEAAAVPIGERLQAGIRAGKLSGQIAAVAFVVPISYYAFEILKYEQKLRTASAPPTTGKEELKSIERNPSWESREELSD